MEAKMRVLWFAWMLTMPFLWFTVLARRTFQIPDGGGPGMVLGAVSLLSGVVLALWEGQHGTYHQLAWAGAAILAIGSFLLYESARRVVRGRGFCVALSGKVPPAVCADGPYRYVRHPVYTSYVLAFLSLLVAFPGLPSAAVFAANLAFFVFVAAHEERTIAHSSLAQAYAAYRRSAGMFLPRFRRA